MNIVKIIISAIISPIKRLFYYPKLVLEETNYDEYWLSKRGKNLGFANAWQKQRGDWILSRIEEGSSVLDIGCGDGGGTSSYEIAKKLRGNWCRYIRYLSKFFRFKRDKNFEV